MQRYNKILVLVYWIYLFISAKYKFSTLTQIDALMEVAGYDNDKLLQEYKAVRVITDLKAKAPVAEQTPTPNT